MKNNHPITEGFLNFLIAWESLHDGDLSTIGLQPKLDACKVPIWTEGYGHAIRVNGKFATVEDFPSMESILPHSTISTVEEARAALLVDVKTFVKGVRKRLTVEVSECEFHSLVSHAYNCGYSETMYRLINSHADEDLIKKWYCNHYITGGGKKLRGLQYRRNDEYQMRIAGDYSRNKIV